MGSFVCQRAACGQTFQSKHSTAKYCSRDCSNKVNVANIVGAKRPRRFSDEEILAKLSELAEKLGKTPSQVEFQDHVGMAGSTVRHHFGSYNRAVEMAGLVPNLPFPPAFTEGEKIVGLALRFRVLARDGYRCTYCGGSPQDGYILHVDHVVPRSQGGATDEANLITACHLCNMGKGAQVHGR